MSSQAVPVTIPLLSRSSMGRRGEKHKGRVLSLIDFISIISIQSDSQLTTTHCIQNKTQPSLPRLPIISPGRTRSKGSNVYKKSTSQPRFSRSTVFRPCHLFSRQGEPHRHP